ncbi:MAG: polysaccharide deacetylase family protein, partial [Armatimonadota bacterium]|nr:polysaccharide deacetylase family protein [Armatimonadota bacterium]
RDGQLEVDPECAIGVLEAFAAAHPDFGLKATFFVLPNGFGQAGQFHRKLQYLVERGLEVGNHTLTHANLKRLSSQGVQAELAGAQREVQKALPGYQFFSLALPLGIAPKEKRLAAEGAAGGTSYRHGAVLLVGSTPAPSPFDRDFEPYAIPRVQATDMVEPPYALTAQLKNLVEKKERRYVSDGDPTVVTVPASLKDEVQADRLGGRKLVVQ